MEALHTSPIRAQLVAFGVLVFLCLPRLSLSAEAESTPGDGALMAPDLGTIADAKVWRVINGEVQVSREGGPTVRLAPIGGNRQGSNLALTLLRGVQFAQGQIDVDLRGNAAGQVSFLGVAFAVADGDAHEAIYFRPFNFHADSPVQRAHAVQYVAWPEYPWDRLRAQRPGAYESAVANVPDPQAWFHVRVEVSASRVNVFVNDATQPCLSVDRLGRNATGEVGFYGGQPAGVICQLDDSAPPAVGTSLASPPPRPVGSRRGHWCHRASG